jgi:hypothetical protein
MEASGVGMNEGTARLCGQGWDESQPVRETQPGLIQHAVLRISLLREAYRMTTHKRKLL